MPAASPMSELRQQLLDAFDDVEFDVFCLDYFADVYGRITRGMRLDEKHTLLLDHCRRKGLLPNLQELLAQRTARRVTPQPNPTSLNPTRDPEGAPVTTEPWDWLGKFGFSADPFTLCDAESEGLHDLLPYFIVDRPYIDIMFGDPSTPRPGFLFAPRGAGKTATRKMVARKCGSGPRGQAALAVVYDDFDPVLNEVGGDLTRLTAKHHVRAIIEAVTKQLEPLVTADDWRSIQGRDRALLLSYIKDFGYAVAKQQLTKLIDGPSMPLEWDDLSPRDMLYEFARILIQLRSPLQADGSGSVEAYRFRSLYILVDCIDESSAGSEGALALLLPLVRDQPLMNTRHVAFRFFLSDLVGRTLMQLTDLHLDRAPHCWIEWTDEALREMVDRRLQYYSGYRIERFGELCHPLARQEAMTRLIEAADASPRTLIRLCGELVNQMKERGNLYIQSEDVSRAISSFRIRIARERP